MSFIAHRRLSPMTLSLAMGLAAFGSALVTVSSASASCGDYLHTGDTATPETTPNEPAPICSGLHCSQRSMTSSPPFIVVERTLNDVLLTKPLQLRDDLVLSAARLSDGPGDLSIGSPESLFRPPIG